MSFLTFDKAGRKGFTLVIVMVMSILMGLSAMALFSSASLDTMIAGNIRRSTIAKHAAVSGINHFMSMNKPVSEVKQMIREHSGTSIVVIPETVMAGGRMSYRVTASESPFLEENMLIIQSIGVYRKGDKIISEKSLTATVASIE